MDDFQLTRGLVVEKAQIAANGDYDLNGDRYREEPERDTIFPYVPLKEIAHITAGNPAPQGPQFFDDGEFSFIRTSDVGTVHLSSNFIGSVDKVNQIAIDQYRLKLFPTDTILFPKSGASTFLNHRAILGEPAYVSSHLACILCNEDKVIPKYMYNLLCGIDARQITPDQAYPSLRLTDIRNIEIPLPPLDVQREIVAEIEDYQKTIEEACATKELFERRIQAALARAWGENIPAMLEE